MHDASTVVRYAQGGNHGRNRSRSVAVVYFIVDEIVHVTTLLLSRTSPSQNSFLPSIFPVKKMINNEHLLVNQNFNIFIMRSFAVKHLL